MLLRAQGRHYFFVVGHHILPLWVLKDSVIQTKLPSAFSFWIEYTLRIVRPLTAWLESLLESHQHHWQWMKTSVYLIENSVWCTISMGPSLNWSFLQVSQVYAVMLSDFDRIRPTIQTYSVYEYLPQQYLSSKLSFHQRDFTTSFEDDK